MCRGRDASRGFNGKGIIMRIGNANRRVCGWVLLLALVLAGTRLGWAAPLPGTLFINEWLAANNSGLRDEDGDHSDWIEIFNGSFFSVDLGGMHLTDTLANPGLWTFPTGAIVPPRGFLVVFASGKDRTDPGPLHTNFRLAGGGERIGLFLADGITAVDAILFGPQTPDISEGRCPDGGDNIFFMIPTPGAPNLCGGGTEPGCLVFDCPDNITLDCQPPGGAPVNFQVMANNLCATNEPITIECSADSGDRFPIGTTAVNCTAASFNGQFWETNVCTFFVTLTTNCPPQPPTNCVEIVCPPDIVVECQSSLGTPVNYPITAENLCYPEHPVFIYCDPIPGSIFPPNSTTSVNCQAISEVDGGQFETNYCSFNVTVLGACPGLPGDDDCGGFGGLPAGRVSNPWAFKGMTWLSTTAWGTNALDTRIDAEEGHMAYHVGYQTEILLPVAAPIVTVDFIQHSGWVEFKALDASGAAVVSPAPVFTGIPGASQRVRLLGGDRPIRTVIVRSPNARMSIIGFCWGEVPGTTALGSYSALDSAGLSVWPSGGLTVTNLTAGGGVRMDLGLDPSLELHFVGDLPATNVASGAIMEVAARDAWGSILGALYGVNIGDVYRVHVNLALGAAGPYRAEVYDGNQLVGSYPNMTEVLWLQSQPSHLEVRMVDGYLQMVLGWQSLQPFQWENFPSATRWGKRLVLRSLNRFVDAKALRYVDLRWSDIFQRDISLCPLLSNDMGICCGPALSITRCEGGFSTDCLAVSWNGCGVLQKAVSLQANAEWQDVTWPVEHSGNQRRVVIPPDAKANQMYFRLRKP